MPQRVVSYDFRASYGQFQSGLAAMGRSVNDLGVKLTALDRNGAQMRAGLDTLGRTAGRIGLVAAAGLGSAVLAAANFDQAMSNVSAATHETAENMELLRQAALDAGASTVFSATEAAGAIESLAKAGVSTKDVLAGGLSGALDLAAAGGLEVAEAAEIAATALTQFKLEGEDVGHVADLLAAGAGKAQGDVTDLGFALKQSGLVASQMGLSIEETTGTLAAFASAGLLGSDAGTSFRTMLLRLANPTDEAAGLMRKFGIEAYDAQGSFVGITALSEQLQTAFAGQTQATRDAALATLFGSDAIRGANVLYEQGAQGIQDWINKTNDAGYAAETAATRMDNLKGDLEGLRGALETALIGAGDGSQAPLRGLVQGATDAVNVFNRLPAPVQSTATGLLAITAVTGGSLWFGSKVVQGVANTREALDQLNVSGGKTKGVLVGIGRAATVFGVIGTGIAVLRQFGEQSEITAEQLQKYQDALIGSAETPVEQLRILRDEQLALLKSLPGDILGGNPFARSQAGAKFDANNALIDSIKAQEAEARKAANSTETYGDALVQTANAAGLSAEELSGLTKSMQEQRKAALDGFDAETQYRQALKDAQEQASKNTAGIKGDSEAALANREALSGLAAAWNNQSDAVKNNEKRFRSARKAFIETATSMGVSREQARNLAKQLLELPDSKVIPVEVRTSAAQSAIRSLKEQLESIRDRNVRVNVTKNTNATVGEVNRASGGAIYGPGTATSDSIPAMLSNGEYVIRAAAVDKYGLGFFDAANQMRLAAGGAPGTKAASLSAYLRDDLGLGFPKTVRAWNQALAASTKELERETDQRQSLIDSYNGVKSAIGSNYRSDLFGNRNIWAAGSGAVSTFGAGLGGDIANLKALDAAIGSLKSKGFDGPALADVLSNGSLADVQSFASQSRAQLAALEAQYAQRDRLLASVGAAGASASFGGALAANRPELIEARRMTAALNRVEALLKKNPDATGKAISKAINGTVPKRGRR